MENKNKVNINENNESVASKVIGIFRTVLIILISLAIVVGALLFASSKSPTKSIFGYRYYTVLTPSMTPTYKVGDLVIVKMANGKTMAEGDVITFNPSTDSESYLTHRVVKVLDNYQGSGVTCYTTKGDANDTEDGFLIDQSRVVGKVVFCIPALGYLVRFVQLRWYLILPLIVMVVVFITLLGKYLDSDEDEEEESDKDVEDKTEIEDVHKEEETNEEDSKSTI